MHRNQEGHMRAHVKQKTISSTSLEGMEQPVRSFQSFVQTAPPNPSETDKALPLTPVLWNRTHSGGERTNTPSSVRPSLASTARTSRTASWGAPAEWYNDNASVESTRTTPSPPPTSTPRIFSPLLPEPSPGPLGMAEPTAWLSPISPISSGLLPIYERTDGNLDLGPSSSPPKLPLPATPLPNKSSAPHILLPDRRRANTPPSKATVATDRVRELSRAGFNKEKAYASLGLDSPLPSPIDETESLQRWQVRADAQYLRGKKLHALHKGSPLQDDSWEDEYMDDKTRELSFSQDYHDLLADQYQEMNIRTQEDSGTGDVQQVREAQRVEPTPNLLQSNLDVPPPLAWRKSPVPSASRSQPQDTDREYASSSGKKSRHIKISSLIPHRSGNSEPNKDESLKKQRRSSQSKHVHRPEADKIHEDDLRFSRFFPSSRPIKFGKKQRKTEAAQPPSVSAPLPVLDSSTRLPGGLVALKTHAPPPNSKADVLSETSPTSTHTRGSSQFGSDYSSATSDPRYSYSDNSSPLKAEKPIPIRSALRSSGASSSSLQSSTGVATTLESPSSSPSLRPPPPPPPSTLSYLRSRSPLLSSEMPKRLQADDEPSEHRYRPHFIDRAMEARRRRLTEAKQDKLKKSIRVLGPTDPGIAQSGYIKSEDVLERSDSDVGGRLLGYLIGGPD